MSKNNNRIDRREFLKLGLATGSLMALGPSTDLVTRVFGQTDAPQKVIILGFDGMDPHLVRVWMDQGKLPSFQRLRSMGDFLPLGSSFPPQSPVAWSNFITGMDPGGHGVFDFIHRDPEKYFPVPSSTLTAGKGKSISIGDYIFPLSGEKIIPVRQGKAFWQILEDYDIPATIFKIPANYPVALSKQRTISGMNTPDILGTYGVFNFYTTEPTIIDTDIGGGRIHEVYVIGNQVEAKIPGPKNAFRKGSPESSVDFRVYLDPVNPVAKIAVQDQEFVLKEGEWTDWVTIKYSLIPTQSISGICKFYLKQIRPEFKLYISAVNINPADPALPISTPNSYSKELAKKFGSFYTQGLPGDFKALNNNILNEEEFLIQDNMVLDERKAMFEYELDRFESGLFFYYVSSTDQRSHMFWRFLDKNNPTYDPKLAAEYGNTIENIYRETDRMLDRAMQKTDKNTILMVMSDHGFAPFRRQFNLNTWLKEAGYHSLIHPWRQGERDVFLNTDWSKTKAYAYGLNGLYINQRGRESEGTVFPGSEKEALIREIAQKLEEYRDPDTGDQPVLRAAVSKNIYRGAKVEDAPDIIVGYNQGYRCSWSSPMGKIPKNIVEDNVEKWSGDHCMAPEVTPGILLSNRKIKARFPVLQDLTATILKIFNIPIPKEITGKPIF